MRFREVGTPKAQCDRCGCVFRLPDLRRDGQTRGALMVCDNCYDPLHPQDLVRGVADHPAALNGRHVTTTAEAVFLTPGEVTEASL